MSSFFNTIDYLNGNIAHNSFSANRTIRKIAGSGDPVRSVADQQGAGGVHFAANLQNAKRSKHSSINSFQNALTMMQMQTEGIRQSQEIYEKMVTLAQMASDPSTGMEMRGLLAKEFADLREEAVRLNSMTFNGRELLDARAASTQYNASFSDGLQAHPHNIENGGMKSDGTFVPDATNSDRKGTDHPYWEVTQDVVYNTGELTIDFRPYGAWDRVMVFQNDEYNPIFDSGEWQTGNKWDRFVIKYGPSQETTFRFANSTENGTGNHYGNKLSPSGAGLGAGYLGKFGLANDGTASGMSDYYEKDLTELGQVKTGDSDPNSSELTVRVIGKAWRGTGYNVEANWKSLSMDDSVVGRSDDLQVPLNQMGLGYLRVNDQAAGFPRISIGTSGDALEAISLLRAEIDNLGEQNGRISSNFTRVEIAMDAAKKQMITQENMLANSGGGDINADLLKLSKARIGREKTAALLTQAMSIHQDVVNQLI
jgi:hypothetical protein